MEQRVMRHVHGLLMREVVSRVVHLPMIRKPSVTKVAGNGQFSIDASTKHHAAFNVTSCSHLRRVGQAA